ncbi:MAG: ABC transporter substrate-binding protein [Zoogloeaceae bacterium]|nr:ABC transporter substrate-binding protein [Zoogloeaceae bacterium]
MKKTFALFALALLALPLFAFAQGCNNNPPPGDFVKQRVEDLLAVVRSDAEIKAGNSGKISAVVQDKVLPYFDFERMTKLALGRDWKKATPDQQRQLTSEFRDLLVRTYSNALSSYKDQKIRYKPDNTKPGDSEALVRTEVVQPGATPIQLDYSLEAAPNCGGWKVYDVVVAGVSLVTNYRDTFAQEVRAGGIPGLIASLSAKNKALAAGKKAE